jgi:hypothetical protein
MTTAEHGLMISMFVKHQMFIKMVIEVLESRGLVSGDDLRAFEFRVNADEPARAELFEYMSKLYVEVAERFGIETGIKPEN